MVYVIPGEKLNNNPTLKSLKRNRQNIFHSLRFFMVCAQILGILPQENIMASQKEIYFTWKSWKVLYTFFFIGLTGFALSLCILDWFYVKYELSALATNVFYGGALATLILYLRLGRSWSKLMSVWCKVDNIMNVTYGYPKFLDKRFRILSILFISLGLADFGLSVINRFNDMKLIFGDKYDAKKYYHEAFPQMFRFVPFNAFTGMICSIVQIYATITWAINDLFIILMSVALALRFKQISERLIGNKKSNTEIHFWTEIREDYVRLSVLCKELDNHISYIVLLSFSWNIFFLLVQLYYSLETVSGFIGHLYFIYSFAYLILKVVTVSVYAAWINDESAEPADILNSVPSVTYNIEIRRLLTQISFDNVALTGCRMFRVTRGIILSIAGAIVTYELVLIQFNSNTVGNT